MIRIRFVLMAAILTGIAMFGNAPDAKAAFKVSMSDGTTTVVVQDNMAGDTNAALGGINFSGTIGVFNINIQLVFSQPLVGGPGVAMLDLNSSIGATGAGILTVLATDTGYTQVGRGDLTESWSRTISGSGNLTGQGYKDTNNQEFGGAGAFSGPVGSAPVFTPGQLGPFAAGGFAQASIGDLTSNPYSMTIRLRAQALASGFFTTGDFELRNSVVPAPAGLILAATGLPFLSLSFLRRRRKNDVQVV